MRQPRKIKAEIEFLNFKRCVCAKPRVQLVNFPCKIPLEAKSSEVQSLSLSTLLLLLLSQNSTQLICANWDDFRQVPIVSLSRSSIGTRFQKESPTTRQNARGDWLFSLPAGQGTREYDTEEIPVSYITDLVHHRFRHLLVSPNLNSSCCCGEC